jgi:DNA-binding protein HU-beta
MTKKEFVDAVHAAMAGKTGYATKTVAETAVDAVVDTLANELAQGHNVNITGFGKFEVKTRAARKGRNPKTGDAIQIAASKGVSFKPGKPLKEALNG